MLKYDLLSNKFIDKNTFFHSTFSHPAAVFAIILSINFNDEYKFITEKNYNHKIKFFFVNLEWLCAPSKSYANRSLFIMTK